MDIPYIIEDVLQLATRASVVVQYVFPDLIGQ